MKPCESAALLPLTALLAKLGGDWAQHAARRVRGTSRLCGALAAQEDKEGIAQAIRGRQCSLRAPKQEMSDPYGVHVLRRMLRVGG